MTKEKKGSSSKQSKKTVESEDFMDKLKQYVRNEGAEYLKDDNITSVGIGYKRKDGKRTKELSVQFTVGRKVSPDILEALDTTPIPEAIVIDGVEVPTDVIQREFKPDYRLIVLEDVQTDHRKIRLNPVEPGISVANVRGSAGTLGCIVYDNKNGTPYILSNWHVLHGRNGAIGDDVVQPGPFDDNRTHLNRLGRLVRSHLGAAGDCAIATIEDRAFKEEIFEIGVKVEQLGEPELDDKVIKSGRTTRVTHGIVTRVHTIAKINYGGTVGEKSIGGFEIGPDENNLPDDGEISKPGDSGSVWLFKASNGKPTRIMAGLHFAGESEGDEDEHAVACYPRSVFEKLEIVLAPPAPEAVIEAAANVGYNPNFLLNGHQVNLPTLSNTNSNNAFKRNNSEVIKYTHFSLALNKIRRFPFWVAWNIDGSSLKRVSRDGIPFILDPNIPAEFQVGDELYRGNRLDRGHVARRADLLWGSIQEARRANVDSFFFTNITPQMDDFNQGSLGGIWGRLEDAIFEDVDVDNLRVSVFGGPVFRADDRVFRGVKIPREFFKVLVFVEDDELKSKGFLLTQSLDQLEALDLVEFRVFEASLAEIEQRCGFTFPDNLRDADSFAESLRNRAESVDEREPISSLKKIAW